MSDSNSASDPAAATEIARLSRAIYVDPEDPALYLFRGDAYLDVCDLQSAIGNYKKALSLVSPSPKATTGSPFSFANVTGKSVAEEIRPGRWIKYQLRRALFLWGQILLDQHRFKEALVSFEESRDLGMCFASVSLRIVAAYIGLGDFDEAIRLLYSLSEKYPTNANFHIIRAKLYQSQGCHDFVAIDLRKAIQADPSHPLIMELLEYVMVVATVYKNKAAEQIKKGHFDIAVFFFSQALELDPFDWCSTFKRGVLFHALGQSESAIEDFTTALEQPERDTTRDSEIRAHLSSAYNKLGVDHFRQGRFLQAAAIFSLAIENKSDEAILYRNRSDCYLKMQRVAEAKDDLQRAAVLESNQQRK
ncbi:hypothetical protein DFJ73DRAFT_279048 [Zopfochytrium polystomum]|nr:hypothetical protein DFJ73DRAFT_279048 [Zopfochytrium polystomum]